ncbi:MAG: HEAT repeat domain-containing protein [Phycisphaeraceae bacterium]|nr:HEAT repeat domain-containing protein [Phycisphaeraceae bacterium]
MELKELVKDIQSDTPETRTAAWQQMDAFGASAVKPLAKLCSEGNMEVRRAAKRGLEKIVRTVGGPGVQPAKRAVIRALLRLLDDSQPVALRREILWLLSEISGRESVESIAALLKHETLREDARMVLERIPGETSLTALRNALRSVPAPFGLNIAQSLRARGETVDAEKYPCQKLVPTK